jgi:hypothetical protein
MAHWFDDTLTLDAATRELSNADLAKFHVYNANGAMADWRKLSERLLAFGRGYLAYGGTGFYYKEMTRLAGLKRVGRNRLYATLSGISRTIDKGEAFLAEQEIAA